MENGKDYDCLIAKQPIGEMYVCVLDNNFLQKIAYADIRRNTDDCRDVEEYAGIQRVLDDKRKKEIGRYVNLVDATFPNSIILSISKENAEYNESTKKLWIKDQESIASVLDGQHRIAGLAYLDESIEFDCIVTIFIDMEMEDQAVIFSTINTEQKKVNKTLVTDLYELYKTRNPQRTCHNIARALNYRAQSPFEGKISILGSARKDQGESLTQYQFVKELLKHISRNPSLDRDTMKRTDFWGNKQKLSCSLLDRKRTCLRHLFIKDENDVMIAQVIFNYFKAVRNRWPNSWNNVVNDNILNKSTGYIALMRFFRDVYLSINKDVPSVEDFDNVFNHIKIDEKSFTKSNYPSGGVGEGRLLKDLKENYIS